MTAPATVPATQTIYICGSCSWVHATVAALAPGLTCANCGSRAIVPNTQFLQTPLTASESAAQQAGAAPEGEHA